MRFELKTRALEPVALNADSSGGREAIAVQGIRGKRRRKIQHRKDHRLEAPRKPGRPDTPLGESE
jgi:hypothetical protein